MSQSFSLDGFSEFITANIEQIGAVRSEVEEIQVGFNSAYVEWKAEHDATLERLTETVIARREKAGSDLQSRTTQRLEEEIRLIAERRAELRNELIPTAQTEADETLGEGQRAEAELRQLNPSLDIREEKLKARLQEMQAELAGLNDRIRKLSGCLLVVFNFGKINRLDRERNSVIGSLRVLQQQLKEVREEWVTFQQVVESEQTSLQGRWRELTIELARLQAELEYLDSETKREALALKRAVRHVIDNLKTPIPCPAEDIKRELDAMVNLNIQTDQYQEGLGSVSGLMSTLIGITEGLNRLNSSVEGLIREQEMHSAYLSKLTVSVPEEALAFHTGWDDLRASVRDDHRLCLHPSEFVDAIRPLMEQDLNEARIATMFNSLGASLSQATVGWRG